VIGIFEGGSSRRPRSIKDCRARGRRRRRRNLIRCYVIVLIVIITGYINWSGSVNKLKEKRIRTYQVTID
jgi:cell division septal protein FtsQ